MWHANFRHQISRLSAERYREMDIEFVHFPPFRRFLLVKASLSMAFSSEQNNNNFTARAANAQWKKCFKAVCFLGVQMTILRTGGPPITRKSLTRFPLPQFLAYIGASKEPSITI
jgi:hypothetical protein